MSSFRGYFPYAPLLAITRIATKRTLKVLAGATLLAASAYGLLGGADTIEGNDTNELVTAASAEHSAPDAEPGNGKASIFGVPREARILFW
jgi:hypothetical protein